MSRVLTEQFIDLLFRGYFRTKNIIDINIVCRELNRHIKKNLEIYQLYFQIDDNLNQRYQDIDLNVSDIAFFETTHEFYFMEVFPTLSKVFRFKKKDDFLLKLDIYLKSEVYELVRKSFVKFTGREWIEWIFEELENPECDLESPEILRQIAKKISKCPHIGEITDRCIDLFDVQGNEVQSGYTFIKSTDPTKEIKINNPEPSKNTRVIVVAFTILEALAKYSTHLTKSNIPNPFIVTVLQCLGKRANTKLSIIEINNLLTSKIGELGVVSCDETLCIL